MESNMIKQSKYLSIKEYTEAIRKTIRKYALCKNIEPELQGVKEEETFIKGLTPSTRI